MLLETFALELIVEEIVELVAELELATAQALIRSEERRVGKEC